MFMHVLFSSLEEVTGSGLPDLQDAFVPNFICPKLPNV